MSKDFNISMNCLILNWFVYDPSWMLHLSEFVRTLRSSVLVVFNNFLLIDATARSMISSDQKRFFIALSLYPLSFFANTPFKKLDKIIRQFVLKAARPIPDLSLAWDKALFVFYARYCTKKWRIRFCIWLPFLA